MIIRRFVDSDLEELRAMWHRTWRDAYGPRLGTGADAVITASLTGDAVLKMFAADGTFLLAIDDGDLCGSLCFAERGQNTYVWGMYVRPDRQRRGIGTALMREALGMLTTSLRIELGAVDPAAVAFYRSLGFVPDGSDTIELFPGVTVPTTRLVLLRDGAEAHAGVLSRAMRSASA